MRAEYKFFVCMEKTTELIYRANEYKEIKKAQRHEELKSDKLVPPPPPSPSSMTKDMLL